ncbi:hypothetical protein SSX86_016475 [Deinandra increscens subsp. villosa]|uniref:Uncharacterized protein n=1 Tax=Deinandra increscens subsp. villosa TaxID=3103831 RepID=A0AAP0D2R7_9ASTR
MNQESRVSDKGECQTSSSPSGEKAKSKTSCTPPKKRKLSSKEDDDKVMRKGTRKSARIAYNISFSTFTNGIDHPVKIDCNDELQDDNPKEKAEEKNEEKLGKKKNEPKKLDDDLKDKVGEAKEKKFGKKNIEQKKLDNNPKEKAKERKEEKLGKKKIEPKKKLDDKNEKSESVVLISDDKTENSELLVLISKERSDEVVVKNELTKDRKIPVLQLIGIILLDEHCEEQLENQEKTSPKALTDSDAVSNPTQPAHFGAANVREELNEVEVSLKEVSIPERNTYNELNEVEVEKVIEETPFLKVNTFDERLKEVSFLEPITGEPQETHLNENEARLKRKATLTYIISDVVFTTTVDEYAPRDSLESLCPGVEVHLNVISALARILNYQEKFKNIESPSRLFCSPVMLVCNIIVMYNNQ